MQVKLWPLLKLAKTRIKTIKKVGIWIFHFLNALLWGLSEKIYNFFSIGIFASQFWTSIPVTQLKKVAILKSAILAPTSGRKRPT